MSKGLRDCALLKRDVDDTIGSVFRGVSPGEVSELIALTWCALGLVFVGDLEPPRFVAALVSAAVPLLSFLRINEPRFHRVGEF